MLISRTAVKEKDVQRIALGPCGLILASNREVHLLQGTDNIFTLPKVPWAEGKRVTSCDCVGNNVVVSTNDPGARVLVSNPKVNPRWIETAIINNQDVELDVIGVRGTPNGGMFVRVRREGLWYSADSGRFALNVSNPMVGVKTDALIRVRNDFFLTTLYGGTLAIRNGGDTVERLPNSLPFAVGTMVVPVNDSVLVACLLQDRYYASYDRGRSWQSIPAPDTFGIVDKMFAIGNTVFLANPKGLRYAKGPDFTWNELEQPSGCVNVQQMMAYEDGIVINCVTGTFIKPLGKSWKPLKVPDYEGPALFMSTIVSGKTLIGSGKEGLYRTQDGGQTWDYIPTPTRRRFIVLGVFQGKIWGFVDNGTICFGNLQ